MLSRHRLEKYNGEEELRHLIQKGVLLRSQQTRRWLNKPRKDLRPMGQAR